ncbi:MAG: hypothetical protein K2K21_16715 [Lachnospiraceae bacterium]|nr:hypothetical protein [Lachnospiraceae bacterium]
MGNETIFYRTERSSLIYFVTEESITGSSRCIKPHFWQKVRLSSFDVDEEELYISTVMIPALQKGWKKEKLLRLMRASIAEKTMQSGNTDVVMQPEVQTMSGQEDTFLSISWSLAGKLLDKSQLLKKTTAKRRKPYPETVVLLLGDSLFPEEQMQKFDEMIQPYLPRINHLTILYELNGNSNSNDSNIINDIYVSDDTYTDYEYDKNRWEEAIADYTEELYYEYGLVATVQCGREFSLSRNGRISGQNTVIFLDFGYSGNIPLRVIKAGDIYLDVFSSEKKEAFFRRKCIEVSYISPRKYLDTVVKSGYDKLVNRAYQI